MLHILLLIAWWQVPKMQELLEVIMQRSEQNLLDDPHRESFRLSSFQRFPTNVRIDAHQFAAAGFYYTGQSDEVKCFACSNTLKNLSSRTDPFLLSMHRFTCRFTRGQDDCGNIRIGLSSTPSTLPQGASSVQYSSAGEVLFGSSSPCQNSNVRSTPTLSTNASTTRVSLTSSTNVGPIRHYQGLDMRNFQTARPAAPAVPSYDVPIYRQLATIPNPDQARLIRSLNLCRESHRFQTFTSDWSSDSAPRAEDMAASGWFYLGNLDRTQCFCCGGVLRNWRRLDNPNTEHITHFPHCLMAQGHEGRNIQDTDRQVARVQALLPATRAASQLTDQQRADLRIMFPCNFPTTPSMQSMAERVRTFNNWHFTRATPQMHAEAGFFALGVRDRVKCFYCNGGLQNWRQNDDPWVEHAKWYPTCEFLLQQKGPEFIHNIVARFPNINRPMLRAPRRDVPPPVPAAPQVQTGPEALPNPPQSPLPSSTDPNFGVTRGPQPQIGRTHTSDPLQAAMESEVATTVIGMGFDATLVRDVIERKLSRDNTGYDSAAVLLEAVAEEQSAREAEDDSKEHRENANAAENSTHVTPMDEDVLDLYGSGDDSELRGVDVAESTAAATSLLRSESLAHNSERSSSSPDETESAEELRKKLQTTLQKLKDERLCKVCWDREADMVFIPCGHISCCLECTKALRMCPICRRKIEKAVRTYIS